MRILITNDDGINSPCLKPIAEKLKEKHEIWIIAPDSERSGCSHSITIKNWLKYRKIDDTTYACSGTPVDCILLGKLHLIKDNIDMVISGPNLGANLGTDILYSGTAAAARQAALMGIPGIASSLFCVEPNSDLNYAIDFISNNLKLFKELATEDHFLNINFPKKITRDVKAFITYPTKRIYNDWITTSKNNGNSDNELYYKIDGKPPDSNLAKGSDCDIVNQGMISMSPIMIHPLTHKIIKEYEKSTFWQFKDKE